MRTLFFVVLAFTASAMADAPTYRHFSDAELEEIFTHVLAMPPIRSRAPEPLRG
jgi:hypothetical protein